MTPEQGAILLWKWTVAAFAGGFLILRSIYAILEREIEVWQGILGITVGLSLTALAISLAMSPWYFPALSLILLVGVVAYLLTVVDNRIREREMLEEDASRYREAIEFDDKNAAAHAYLARVYWKQGRLHDAVTEFERALELDQHDTESRNRLKWLVERMGEMEGAPRCPQCEGLLDAAGKTCPECGWSRSTVKGLRDVYASGALKKGLLYGVIATVVIGLCGWALGVSYEFTTTLLLILWLAGVVLFFRWLLQDLG